MMWGNSKVFFFKWWYYWNSPWCWERLRAGGEGGDRGGDGWMASWTQRTWVWANSGRQCWPRSPVCCGPGQERPNNIIVYLCRTAPVEREKKNGSSFITGAKFLTKKTEDGVLGMRCALRWDLRVRRQSAENLVQTLLRWQTWLCKDWKGSFLFSRWNKSRAPSERGGGWLEQGWEETQPCRGGGARTNQRDAAELPGAAELVRVMSMDQRSAALVPARETQPEPAGRFASTSYRRRKGQGS